MSNKHKTEEQSIRKLREELIKSLKRLTLISALFATDCEMRANYSKKDLIAEAFPESTYC